MKSLWNEQDVSARSSDLLTLRTYTSNLIGQCEDLVLHGGGNTSVKVTENDFFGEPQEILYVKGSGWDLATIKPEGFAPVKLSVLRRLAMLSTLSDSDMVREQKAAMTNPQAPTPSIEAILHGIIPYRFVDHTHADAVVTVTNCVRDGEALKKIFGDRALIFPYVMPGFVLARQVYEQTQDVNWEKLEAIVLMHHGIFTFADSAKESYERMIAYVSRAEGYRDQGGINLGHGDGIPVVPEVARLRQCVSQTAGRPMLARFDGSLQRRVDVPDNFAQAVVRGPLTPDHVIHTKPKPLVVGDDVAKSVDAFAKDYQAYYERHRQAGMVQLDPAPRWAYWPNFGTVAFGANAKALQVVSDIAEHTLESMLRGERLGGWWGLPPADLFAIEYWELEQAKLRKGQVRLEFEGQVALVTGAASGIGKACVEELMTRGAQVVGLDINPQVTAQFSSVNYLGLKCDATSVGELKHAVAQAINWCGGIDIVVSNAGNFPASCRIENLGESDWQKSLEVNLTSHEKLLNVTIPFLKLGWQPAVVIVGSKNVPAPGPGAAAYSVAKAGLTQLARVAALELGADGIRVNVVHPNAVFDTGIWSDEVLGQRAKNYGLSVDEYKRNNVMKTEVTSRDVARLVASMAGVAFAKTTGAQVPVDGGNDRVI